ncbi:MULTISPECIES: class I SAM-dependent methyltransferase [Sphingobacterium]|uniref:class I SAM-dependent methyltransferase n=1 Tax=Sphingobacterium TaxID=28453 RepID=UPI001051D4D9|nr:MULTISPECIES: class I SAM-dependent methyltransferase [Sphingobacterium]MCW2258610.1 hypothetical protein [Sphingobacterium kitahiroshimense]TCR14933.1 methyltransferase family protein [Sphingobacterium sp. JUb78]
MRLFRGVSTFLKAIQSLPQFISIFNEYKEILSRNETQLRYFTDQLIAMKMQHDVHASSKDFKEGAFVLQDHFSLLERKINLNMQNYFQQMESLLSIYRSLPNLKHLPNTRGWVGSPDFLLKLVEIVLKRKPQFVFELSSGVSSIILGTALQLNQLGHLLSIDHEESYANVTRANIELNGIDKNCSVKVCPLVNVEVEGITYRWYDLKTIQKREGIDCLVIDGPPGSTQPLARYPAVPLLYNFFSDKMVIIMDDANRRDEQIIIDRWVEFLHARKFKVQRTDFPAFEKGLVVLEVSRIA